jgi:hypothetical protein
MAPATFETPGEGRAIDFEVEEPDSGAFDAECRAVGRLQRRTGQNERPAILGESLVDEDAERREPGATIFVLEPDAASHLFATGLRMVVIGVDEIDPEARRQPKTERGLSRTRDAHHDDDDALTYIRAHFSVPEPARESLSRKRRLHY